MLFNSFHFSLFFPFVVMGYFLLPHRLRWGFLLAASYYFYMCWKVEYLFLIIASTLVDYTAGIRIAAAKTPVAKRIFLLLSLAVNLGLLLFFRYFSFIDANVRLVLNQFNIFYESPSFELLLPVGISFYTFQTLSYTIDVYQGKKTPERHLGIFALYVSFFPQLVAGPIERSQRLLPQLHQEKRFDYDRVRKGLLLMLWGYFQKLVIADRVAVLVDAVYADPSAYAPIVLVVATYFFAFQIFCDFAGYSNIAIGAAQIMGYDLMTNFRRPYFAESIREFWRRWHISLTSWFRDYVYIPLGGSRVSAVRWYFNIMLVFLVSGLWHGAAWTFIIWGALHGFYLLCSHWTGTLRSRLYLLTGMHRCPFVAKCLAVLVTFHLVCFAWIFFRAVSLEQAVFIISQFKSDFHIRDLLMLPLPLYDLLIAGGAICLMEGIHFWQRRQSIRDRILSMPTAARWTVYYGLVLVILIFGEFSGKQFIYFQF